MRARFMNPILPVLSILPMALLGAWVLFTAAALAETPPAFEAQLRADWLRQNQLREHPIYQPPRGAKITPEEDAIGGCDGVKNGEWGFHTQNEPRPWWRVDLGQPAALGHVLLYNRCDPKMAPRNAHVMVLVSDDDKTWREAARNNGVVFMGQTDGKPLRLELNGVQARYVRLQLPGTNYLHLDEVEIYPAGGKSNIALGRPATQSSVSLWSVAHALQPKTPAEDYAIGKVVARGFKLAEDLQRRGVDAGRELETLRRIEGESRTLLPGAASGDAQTSAAAKGLYCDACASVRALALRNPLLDFDSIVFVKNAPGRFPHMSDQFYGWWSRPGGGVCILEHFKSGEPRVRCLTGSLPPGSFIRPDLSYDGQKILFAYCRFYPALADERDKADKRNDPEDAFYHLYEINVDGTGLKRLTHGKYDDFNGIYLPGGGIAFLSTRKGVALQCSQASAQATRAADLPDSYVRCGGDEYRPVPVFTLHTIDGSGGSLRPISAFENFEWTPAVAHDGRILYTRWDYIDRFNGHFFSLWSTNPDGTNPQLVYGNYTVRPQVKFEARPIPNSNKLIMTAGAHHSNVGGTLVLLDRTRGTEEADPLVRLTPEVPYPETEAWGDSYYANPYPLSEEHYLVSWSDRRLPPHARVEDEARNPSNASGIYLYDAFGNLTLLYRDPAISSLCPIPVKARPRPHAYPDTVQWAGAQEGVLMLQDVYRGLPGVERGSVKRLRVVAVPPKVQPRMNTPSIGISKEDPGKYVLGTVPVEADGSAHFRVPSGVPVFFQALDGDGAAVQTMRSLTYVQPKQTLSCVGCHEPRESAPPGRVMPAAFRRDPSRLKLGPEGTWPLRYDRLVQPVLDRHCVSCHAPDSREARASKLDLTAAKSYDSLMDFGEQNLRTLAFERDRSAAGEAPARQSRLLALLSAETGHEGVKLDREGLDRLVIWMDTYAQRTGHFSEEQEAELGRFRDNLKPLLEPYGGE